MHRPRHNHLKDLAIEALSCSELRDRPDIYNRLLPKLKEYGSYADETADVLAQMVVSAYVVAQHLHKLSSSVDLQATFPHFTAQQLEKIVNLALEG